MVTKQTLFLALTICASSVFAGPLECVLYYRFSACGIAYDAPQKFDIVPGASGANELWWREACAAPNLAAICVPTNDAAAMAWAKTKRADISGAHSALSVEEKALGLTTITLLNGRLSNLVVVLNKKMGLTGTNRITAASIGGTITPQEASQILQGYLQ